MTRTPGIGPALALLLVSQTALAHVNPPVVLLSDRDAMAAVLTGATTFAETRVTLTPQQKQTLLEQWRFKAEAGSYRIYAGRDAKGREVGSVVFLTHATIHSPVRIAVGLGQEGRIAGVAVVEISEESYPWVKPLIDQGFGKSYVGLGARGEFEVPEFASGRQGTMQRFYAKVIAYMTQWGAALYETAGLTRVD